MAEDEVQAKEPVEPVEEPTVEAGTEADADEKKLQEAEVGAESAEESAIGIKEEPESVGGIKEEPEPTTGIKEQPESTISVNEEPESTISVNEELNTSAITHKGIISDPSLLPESNNPAEIRKQVEFYFSDSNLRFDKFLFGLVGKENKWVPLKMVASFKRMQRFKDFAGIQEALETSELLELNPQKTQVRRKVPLDLNVDYEKIKEIRDKTQSRSLYAKGFGEETPTTQYDIEKFFEPYGPLNAVRLRRDDTRVFKGSVFVEFKSDELMEKFIAIEEKPKFLDTEMLYMRKKDYVEMKIQDIKEGKIQPQSRKPFRAKPFDALILERNSGKGGKKGGDRNGQKRGSGNRGRGGGGRRPRRGGRNDRSQGGQRNEAAGDPHTIPKVQASSEQGVKRSREEDGDETGNGEKKIKVETESGEQKFNVETESEEKKTKVEGVEGMLKGVTESQETKTGVGAIEELKVKGEVAGDIQRAVKLEKE